jgi:protein SCO1/2
MMVTRKTLTSATLVAALGIILVLGVLAGRTFRGPARVTSNDGMTVLEPASPLPEFRLHDQNNQVFDRARLQGKWSYVFFGYTHCPDICPTTLVVLRDVQKLAGGQDQGVQYIFVSVDPERDKAATLNKYVSYFHPEFIGVTGGQDELMRLTRALGVYYERGKARNGDYEVQHSAAIFLIDPEARLRALFAGPHNAARLAQGLQRLKGS